MRSDKITNGSGAALAALVIVTNGYSVLPASSAGRSVWISHIAASLLAFICTYWFVSVCEKNPEKSFYEVLEATKGKLLAKITALGLVILSLMTCVLSLTIFSRFVQITALPQTPQIIITLLVILIAALAVRGGLRATSGAARLLFWFCAAVFVIFAVFGIKWMKPSLLLPSGGMTQRVLTGTGEVFLNRFGAIPALMAVYTRMPEGKERKGFFLLSVVCAAAALTVISAVTAATLGAETMDADFYPVYTAMSVRGVGGFIQHTEIIACIAMTLSLFFKSAVCLLFSDDMLTGIFKVSRKEGVAVPLALISAALTQVIYRDLSSLRGMVEWKNGAIYVVALYILIPAELVLFSWARESNKRKNR